MLRLTQLTLPIDHTEEDLRRMVVRTLRLPGDTFEEFVVRRRSTDARKRTAICFTYTVDVALKDEDKVLADLGENPHVAKARDLTYRPVMAPGPASTDLRPVVVGTGPCGLFAGLLLAEMGLAPLVLERGKPAIERAKDVARFWNKGELDPSSNVQFGEGGAGTFSDGKLTTQIKDRENRCRKVLEELVAAGAPEEILWLNKPHIGTDILVKVVANLRQRIIALGGEVRFESQVVEVLTEDGAVRGVTLDGGERIDADTVVLAIGHSARDTFEMLHAQGVRMDPKAFSIGLRIEHPQQLIDETQFYKFAGHSRLGHADYKLVHHCANGRSVYTFCMCPGGQVIACSSEPGMVVTNGMSAYKRNKPNANSGLLVGVKPEDFQDNHPLAGVAFQRQWERKAFELGGGGYKAPAQLVGDFLLGRVSQSAGEVEPSYRPGVKFCDLSPCLPDYGVAALREAIKVLDRKLRGFAMPEAVLTGVETRSSSPVRITRGPDMQSVNTQGLYPAGEGAGYAGGIISAAVDGIRVAEAVARCRVEAGDMP